MIGSELASRPEYLVGRAKDELGVGAGLSKRLLRWISAYVSIMGIPEVGMQVRIDAVLRNLPRNVGRFADVGAGSGILLKQISKKKKHADLVGIEPDVESCIIAKELNPDTTMINGLAQDAPPFVIGQCDTVATVDVLEHIADEDLDAFISSCSRLLKPGGRLVIHVPLRNQRRHFKRFANWEHHDHAREGMALDELDELLRRHGFRIVHHEYLLGWLGSFAWELNMLFAMRPIQALVYPVAMLLARFDHILPSRRYNTLLCVARANQHQS